MTLINQMPNTTVPIQNEIEPFHANGPALKMNTGVARTSGTIRQIDK